MSNRVKTYVKETVSDKATVIFTDGAKTGDNFNPVLVATLLALICLGNAALTGI